MEMIASSFTPLRYIPYLQEISLVVIPLFYLASFKQFILLPLFFQDTIVLTAFALLQVLAAAAAPCCLLRGPRLCGAGGTDLGVESDSPTLYPELRHQNSKALNLTSPFQMTPPCSPTNVH